MKHLQLTLAALIVFGFITSNAMAATSTGEKYVVLDIGQVSTPDLCSDLGIPSCTDSSIAYRFGAGYQLNPNVGFEVGYATGIEYSASGGGAWADLTASGLQFAVIGYLPLNDTTEILGKFAYAKIDVSVESSFGADSYNNSNTAFGLGVRFAVSPQIKIRAMYEDFGTVKSYTGDPGSNTNMISAGLQFAF